MDLTQEQFEENLMAMPEEDKLSVLTVMEQSEPEGLVNFAEALGVNLIMEGEEPVAEEPVAEEVAPEEPVAEEVAPEEPIDPAAIAAIEGVPPAEPASVLPPPAAPEPVTERPIDQEMQALAEGGDIQDPAEVPEEEPAAEVVGPIAVSGADTSGVGDDVAMTGQEGDFILTDAAVENSGLVDVRNKLRASIDVAKEDGLEFNLQNIVKPAKQINGSVDYMASNGEIRIPKALVRYVGLDVLGKMNAAVEEKTEDKINEQEQKPAEKTIPVRA